ncbi:trafficking protein particle complex subunit 12-like [Diadema antillarum]|uniref:trafficking protein particle complex subunit 12-like n=1 Tax=Diadema antillarum TaxID=105358 RepID=UPI003A87FFB2
MADPIGASNAPNAKPFDASLFDQGTVEKPVSPGFPVESPFMSTGGNPSAQEEITRNQPNQEGSGGLERVGDAVLPSSEDNAGKGKLSSAANYFRGEEALVESSGSFFDSFSSARADENNLFSTPPTSTGVTPLSPEGPGFSIMEDRLGIGSEVSVKSLEAAGVNSETLSMDSANLLADDDQKPGMSVNPDTVSMDSTNLLSEEDKDEHSIDQGNDSFDGKNELEEEEVEVVEGKEEEKKAGDDSSQAESSQEALGTAISLESPDTDTSLLEDSITKSSSELGENTLQEDDTFSDPLQAAPASPGQDGECDEGAKGPECKTNADTPTAAATPAVQPTLSTVNAPPSPSTPATPSLPSTLEEEKNPDPPKKTLSPPPQLMSSFSAPSGLVNPSPSRPRAPFQSSSSQEGDDPFVAALRSSDSDRRHDAWLPSEATQKILANRSIALQGTDYVVRDHLTMPGVIVEEPQGDPVKELVYRSMGEQECAKRSVLTINQVTRDEAGLKRLLDAGCLRAAIDLTGLLLTSGGQGKGQSGLPSRHTPHLMQVWFTRIAVLMKLQQFTVAEQELEPFGNMDKPDLFFEYYPDLYPGRKGSIIPFSFRVIHAELPMYVSKHQVCLDRLSAILTICQRIIQNLREGKSEYRQQIELSEENRKASLDLWKSREVRVLHSIGNCLVSMKEYLQAVNVFKSLIGKEPDNEVNILCGIARVYLQLGDLKSAQETYGDVEKKLALGGKEDQARIHINRGFLKVAQNQYAEGYKHFNEALKIEPGNFMAINNVSVCCLYLGRLKEALSLLENLVNHEGSEFLDEALVFNLCTLYELESSKSAAKKQNLLGLVSRSKGDGFNVGCLKMT